MTLAEWIKANVKDDANVEEGLALVNDLDPLKNIDSTDAALDFMKRNPQFQSALDAANRRAVEANQKRFEEEKLPELRKALREEAMKELNPEETPEQKQIRELREQMAERDRRDALVARKDELRKKAQEIGFDPIRAERYAVLGDGALEAMTGDAHWFQTTLKSELDKASKSRFKSEPPAGGNGTPTGKQMTEEQFAQLPPREQMKLMTSREVTLVNDLGGEAP
jgi:actin-related protein